MAGALPFGEVEPHRPVTLGVVEPALAHLDVQEEMHGRAVCFTDVFARRRADRLDGAPALAEYDLAVALAGDEDRLLDAGRPVGLVLPLIGLDGRLIGQFVVQPLDQLLAGDFGRERADRGLRDLVLRIEPGTGWDHCGETLEEPRQPVAGRGADHEGLVEGERRIEFGREVQQLRALDEVDLIENSEPRLPALGERGQDGLRLLAQTRVGLLAGVDQEHERVGVGRRAPGGGDHRPVEAALGREQAGRVDEHDLRLAPGQDATHDRAGGLRLAGDDRDFLADQRVDQRRLAGVGRADDRDEPASGRAQLPPQRSRKACAAACSAARFELAAPISGANPSSVTRMTKWGACAGPLRSTSSYRGGLSARDWAHSCTAVLGSRAGSASAVMRSPQALRTSASAAAKPPSTNTAPIKDSHTSARIAAFLRPPPRASPKPSATCGPTSHCVAISTQVSRRTSLANRIDNSPSLAFGKAWYSRLAITTPSTRSPRNSSRW